MRCGRVRDLFSRCLENAMDSALSGRFDEHLAACAACREAYERFSATVVMLDEMPEVEPPADFHAAVMARVEQARRTTPQPVRWWRIDWQHVFTIRVPARAAALGLAVVLLAAVAFQLTPVGQTGVALFFGPAKSINKPISDFDSNAPKAWHPWHSQAQAGLLIDVKMEANSVYAIRLVTRNRGPIGFALRAGESSYSGVVIANQDSVIRIPAPESGLSEAKIAWNCMEQSRQESIFLPAKLQTQASPRSFILRDASVRDTLRKIAQEYGIVVIARGDLNKNIPHCEVNQLPPGEALYNCLEDTGLKSRAEASSVFTVEPER